VFFLAEDLATGAVVFFVEDLATGATLFFAEDLATGAVVFVAVTLVDFAEALATGADFDEVLSDLLDLDLAVVVFDLDIYVIFLGNYTLCL
jgi:hypothetical protein